MKKLILTALIIISTVYPFTTGLYAQQPFTRPDTISRTVGTAVFDTVLLSGGYKTIYLTNSTAGLLTVCFSYLSGGQTYRDTVNYFTVNSGITRIFPMRDNKYMYLKSTVSGTVTGVIDYGIGESSRENAVFVSPKIDTLIYIDSLRAGDSTKTYNCRGYDFAILYGVADTSAGTYLDSIGVWIKTATGNAFKIGVKKLINNVDDSLVTSTADGKMYMIFTPYIENLMLRLNNAIYYAGRKWKFELHLYRKR